MVDKTGEVNNNIMLLRKMYTVLIPKRSMQI